VVLAHYALAHAAAVNLGAQVRYAVFFRLHHPEHAQAGIRPLTELWSEWEGVR
jgi:ectoine hydroxylase-related dioxygenase (phytanoyl-CoA dioxygenase family)